MIQASPFKARGYVSYFLCPKAENYTETPGYQLFCETHVKLSDLCRQHSKNCKGAKKHEQKIPMKLQIFAEPPQPPEQNPANPAQASEGQSAPAFDYDKLTNLIAGKQSVTEESVLKGYFKQQGLSKEQMEQAITAFKQQQADKQPDVAGMQNQITETQKQLTQHRRQCRKHRLRVQPP